MTEKKKFKRVCKAKGCGKEFLGAGNSKFCSLNCRGIGEAKKPFVSETILIKSEEINAKEEAYKKEKASREAKRAILSLPDDKRPVVLMRPNSNSVIREVKTLLYDSVTMDQIISNIATRHKYKKAESYVSHIEDMLLLYAKD